jgi:hypothetical protein
MLHERLAHMCIWSIHHTCTSVAERGELGKAHAQQVRAHQDASPCICVYGAQARTLGSARSGE